MSSSHLPGKLEFRHLTNLDRPTAIMPEHHLIDHVWMVDPFCWSCQNPSTKGICNWKSMRRAHEWWVFFVAVGAATLQMQRSLGTPVPLPAIIYTTNVNEPFRGSTLGVTRQGYHTWQYLHTSLQKNLGKLQMQTIPHCMRSLPPGVLTVIDIGRFTHYKWVVYPPEMGCLPTTNGWFAHFKQGGLPTR